MGIRPGSPKSDGGQALPVLLLGMAAVALIALAALSLAAVRQNLSREYLARTQAVDAARAGVVYGEELLRKERRSTPSTFSFSLPPATVNGSITLYPDHADRWLVSATAVVGSQRAEFAATLREPDG